MDSFTHLKPFHLILSMTFIGGLNLKRKTEREVKENVKYKCTACENHYRFVAERPNLKINKK